MIQLQPPEPKPTLTGRPHVMTRLVLRGRPQARPRWTLGRGCAWRQGKPDTTPCPIYCPSDSCFNSPLATHVPVGTAVLRGLLMREGACGVDVGVSVDVEEDEADVEEEGR